MKTTRARLDPKDSNFFVCLDGIRGVAAIIIMIRHSAGFFDGVIFTESFLAVDVFFLLSGFVICNVYEKKLAAGLSVITFALIRLVRIWPLYAIGILIACAYAILDKIYNFNSFMVHSILSVLLIPNPDNFDGYYPLNESSWLLLLELLVNVLYAVYLPYLSNRILNLVVIICLVGMFACVFASYKQSLDIGSTVRTFPAGLFRVGYSFFLGVILRRPLDVSMNKPALLRGAAWRRRYLNACSYLIVPTVILVLTTNPRVPLRPFYEFAAVTVAFPLLVWLAAHVQLGGSATKIYIFLGSISYAMYSIHGPFRDWNVYFLSQLNIMKTDYAFSLMVPLYFVLIVSTCFLLDVFFDTPIRQFLYSEVVTRTQN